MKPFMLCFIPLFVAVDAVGVLPLFMGLTEGVDDGRRRRIVLQSVLTAASVVAVFIFAGPRLLRVLGITVNDFMIAGGALLFVIALRDLLLMEKTQRAMDPDTLGAVPIGVPLITGPAVLTTSMLLVDQYGPPLTLAAALLNVGIAGVVFWFAGPIRRTLGSAGTKILSKIASLLLASIAVMLIRRAVEAFAGRMTGPA